jgi:hypothetical protein
MVNKYKHLTIKERYDIEAFCKLGFSARKMATELVRSNKTISTELTLCSAKVLYLKSCSTTITGLPLSGFKTLQMLCKVK